MRIKTIIDKEEKAAKKMLQDDEMEQVLQDNEVEDMDLKAIGVEEVNKSPSDLKEGPSLKSPTSVDTVEKDIDAEIKMKQ